MFTTITASTVFTVLFVSVLFTLGALATTGAVYGLYKAAHIAGNGVRAGLTFLVLFFVCVAILITTIFIG